MERNMSALRCKTSTTTTTTTTTATCSDAGTSKLMDFMYRSRPTTSYGEAAAATSRALDRRLETYTSSPRRQQQHTGQQGSRSPIVAASQMHPFGLLAYPMCRSRGMENMSPSASPINEADAVSPSQSFHLRGTTYCTPIKRRMEPPAHQLAASPLPRTPLPCETFMDRNVHTGENCGRGRDAPRVVTTADLCYPSPSMFSITGECRASDAVVAASKRWAWPATQLPRAAAEPHQQEKSPMRDAAESSWMAAAPAGTIARCWICESRCAMGPGPAWHRTAVCSYFFRHEAGTPPVSTLTLCATCTTAFGGEDSDISSTNPLQILKKCHRTPILRHRTCAFVRAVQAYATQLQRQAAEVVKMSSSEDATASPLQEPPPSTFPQQPQHPYDTGALTPTGLRRCSPKVSLQCFAEVPATVQERVLRGLLHTLERSLQRDRRAVQLAAEMTQMPRSAEQQIPCTEVMTSRERHVLLAEVAHVERWLMGGLTERLTTRASLGKHREEHPACRERDRISVDPRTNLCRLASAGKGALSEDADDVVSSPRPALHPSFPSPKEGTELSCADGARAAATRLTAVADPRRLQYYAGLCKLEEPGTPSFTGSSSRERSPPELTSPQRTTFHWGHHDINDVGAEDTDADKVDARFVSTRANGSVDSARSKVPFPFMPVSVQRATNSEAAGSRGAAALCRSASQRSRDEVKGEFRRQGGAEARRPLRALVETAMRISLESRADAKRRPDDGAAGEESEMVLGDGADPSLPPPSRNRDKQEEGVSKRLLSCGFAGRPSAPSRASPGGVCTIASSEMETSPLASCKGCVAAPCTTREGEAALPAPSGGREGDATGAELDPRSQHLRDERHLRMKAEEALAAAHARIAALELTTNSMAETLMTHRLAVTLEGHLRAMEALVGRWVRLALNFALQKSQLFAEEATLMMRQLQRERCGLVPLLSVHRRRPLPPSGDGLSMASHGPRGVELGDTRVSGGGVYGGSDEELWLTRDDLDDETPVRG